MTSKKLSLLVVLVSLISVIASAQDGPPGAAVPSEKNTALIKKIIEVTKHEQYVIEYCTQKVRDHATQKKWTQSKTNEILQSIKFKYYDHTIYNTYAFYTTEQLKQLLDALTSLVKEDDLPLVLTNYIMQSNLDLFVKSIIEGKYTKVK